MLKKIRVVVVVGGTTTTQRFENSSGLVHFITQRQHGDA